MTENVGYVRHYVNAG